MVIWEKNDHAHLRILVPRMSLRASKKLRPMQSNDNEVTCPRCGSKVKKMLSVVAAVGRSHSDESYASGGGRLRLWWQLQLR